MSPTYQIHQVAEDSTEGREAIAILLTGSTRAPHIEAVVEHFRHFLASQRYPDSHLWLARRGPQPLAASLQLPAAGRTGMLLISPAAYPAATAALGELLDVQLAAFRAEQEKTPAAQTLQLLQCLLDPGQRAESQLLQERGFELLARLIYMEIRLSAGRISEMLPASPQQEAPALAESPWRPERADRFGKAIEASYVATRDCPALVGRRSMEDILAAHRGRGPFDPTLWTLCEHQGQPVAVCLINPTADGQNYELVYLGVAAPFRGQGIARRLLQKAMHRLAATTAPHLLLAVDAENEPALKLYRTLGFSPTLRKHALILSVSPENK